MHFKVKPDGTVLCIYSDDMIELYEQGDAKTKRASHVEPDENGDGWVVDLTPVGGPVMEHNFRERGDALAAEVEWIQEHVLS